MKVEEAMDQMDEKEANETRMEEKKKKKRELSIM
jgi:hypothetical protein